MGYIILGTPPNHIILGDENDVNKAKRDLGEPYYDENGNYVSAEDIKRKDIIGA